MKKCGWGTASSAFLFAAVFFYVNEDNVSADLNDAAPRDEEFKVAAEKPAEAAGTRYNQ